MSLIFVVQSISIIPSVMSITPSALDLDTKEAQPGVSKDHSHCPAGIAEKSKVLHLGYLLCDSSLGMTTLSVCLTKSYVKNIKSVSVTDL